MILSAKSEALLSEKLKQRPHIVMAPSLRLDIDDVVTALFPRCKLAVVDDVRTADALGSRVFSALGSRYEAHHVTLPGFPAADEATAHELRARTSPCDVLVAVGSGTINDLTKYVAALDGKPYVVFPTAASMNGYTSANASIEFSGHKTSKPAQMPVGVFCDLSVIVEAPARLGKSGLGDSIARPTAQADWLLSHLLLNTNYDEAPFEVLKEVEEELFANARGIAMTDMHSTELLMRTLLLSGLGMSMSGGSYPASQGEHMIAHAYGMLHSAVKPDGLPNLHGEEIGVTTLYMAHRQEALLRSSPRFLLNDFNMRRMTELFGSTIARESADAFGKKHEAIIDDQIMHWDDVAQKLTSIVTPVAKLEAILKAAEAPTLPEAIGWSDADFKTACDNARYTRDRFTFLDIG